MWIVSEASVSPASLENMKYIIMVDWADCVWLQPNYNRMVLSELQSHITSYIKRHLNISSCSSIKCYLKAKTVRPAVNLDEVIDIRGKSMHIRKCSQTRLRVWGVLWFAELIPSRNIILTASQQIWGKLCVLKRNTGFHNVCSWGEYTSKK